MTSNEKAHMQIVIEDTKSEDELSIEKLEGALLRQGMLGNIAGARNATFEHPPLSDAEVSNGSS